jgi:DNA-binding SARP family transcriptional activator
MSALTIRLFGTVRIAHQGVPGPTKLIHGVQALLAYLLLYRDRLHHREALGGLFWGEHTEDRARSCLSTAIWRLRQVLEPEGIARGTYLLVDAAGEVGFNGKADYWLDVAELEDGVRRLQRTTLEQERDLAAAEEVLSLYTADLLEGFYAEWALRERERLRLLYLDGMARLLGAWAAGDEIDRALGCARRILALDPLREEIHREVIRLCMRAGRRALALQQYEQFRELLAQELGVEPMPETQALYLGITRRAVDQGDNAADPRASAGHQLLHPLQRAARNLDVARAQLRRAMRLARSAQEADR